MSKYHGNVLVDTLQALERDWLVRLQANHPDDTVENVLGPVAYDLAADQMRAIQDYYARQGAEIAKRGMSNESN